jgi:hypothetical protein
MSSLMNFNGFLLLRMSGGLSLILSSVTVIEGYSLMTTTDAAFLRLAIEDIKKHKTI